MGAVVGWIDVNEDEGESNSTCVDVVGASLLSVACGVMGCWFVLAMS